MTTITRRLVLKAAPGAAAALLPLASRAEPAENPDLLALSAQMPAVEQRYQEAIRTWKRAWDEWSPQLPLAPDCCTVDFGQGEMERDLSGRGLIRPGENTPRRVLSMQELERSLEWAIDVLRKPDFKKGEANTLWKKNLADAELGIELLPGYLKERDRVMEESNFEAIDHERTEAFKALFAFVRSVLETPSRGTEGVRIKARAAAMIGRLKRSDLAYGSMVDMTGPKMHLAALLGQAMLEKAP